MEVNGLRQALFQKPNQGGTGTRREDSTDEKAQDRFFESGTSQIAENEHDGACRHSKNPDLRTVTALKITVPAGQLL